MLVSYMPLALGPTHKRPEIAMKTLPAYTEKPELAELLDKVPLLPAEEAAE